MNFISLAVLQSNLNKLLNNDANEEIA
jgi:hypothetical protein